MIEVHTIEHRDEDVLQTTSLNPDHILGTAPANASRPALRGKVLFYDGSDLLVTETRTQLDRMINGQTRQRNSGTYYVENAVPGDPDD